MSNGDRNLKRKIPGNQEPSLLSRPNWTYCMFRFSDPQLSQPQVRYLGVVSHQVPWDLRGQAGPSPQMLSQFRIQASAGKPSKMPTWWIFIEGFDLPKVDIQTSRPGYLRRKLHFWRNHHSTIGRKSSSAAVVAIFAVVATKGTTATKRSGICWRCHGQWCWLSLNLLFRQDLSIHALGDFDWTSKCTSQWKSGIICNMSNILNLLQNHRLFFAIQ